MSAAKLLDLRCSALPRAFLCPGSVREVDLRIESSGEPAQLGSAAHAVLDQVVTRDLTSLKDVTDLEEIAARFGVDLKDLRPLVWYGIEAWTSSLRETMPSAQSEVPLGASGAGFRLSGHADVIAVGDAVAAVNDWKSGRVDADHSHQVKGYAWLIFCLHPAVMTVHASITWLRDQEIETYTITRADADAWADRLRRRVVEWDGRTFHPGPACTYCPRSHDCPAIVASTRRDIAILSEFDPANPDDLARVENGIAALAPADAVALLRRARAIETLAGRVKDMIRRRVQQDGSLASGSGTELRLVATKGNREIDPIRAWPALHAAMSDDELATCITVSVGAVEDVVAAKAGKGKGAGAKRALAKALEDAGAISRTPGAQLREIRIGTANDDKETQ